MNKQRILEELGISQFSVRQKITHEALHTGFKTDDLLDNVNRHIRHTLGDEAAKNATVYIENNIHDFTVDVYGTIYIIRDVKKTYETIEELVKDAYEKGYLDASKPKLTDGNTVEGTVE